MRGESGRVAARVRQLLIQSGAPSDYGPSGADRSDAEADAEADGAAESQLVRSAAARPPWWQRLHARIPIRLDPGRRAALAMGSAVAVAALVTGLWVLAARPRALAVSASASAPARGSSPVGTAAPAPASPSVSPAASATPTVVVVDVAGKVRHPGLYRLPLGARVDDAVRAAGGTLPGIDLSSLNLAARVVDGQQIPVGIVAAAGPAPANGPPAQDGDGAGARGAAPGPVDLNTAGLDQLETLPGVGPVLGQHILDWRAAHGRFATADQLLDVSGIGPAKFAALRGLVTA